jgi:lipopolysaccharide export LptBFGC system permease protein LptF
MSVTARGINELWAPQSGDQAEAILNRSASRTMGGAGATKVRHLGFTNSRDNRIWQIGLYDSETGEMMHPQVLWRQEDGSRMWLKAERGRPMEDGGWLFENATQYLEAAGTNTIPQLVLQTNSLAMPQFTETPELVRSEIKVSRRLGVGESKRSDLAISEILNYLRLHPNPSKSDAAWLHTKLQGRLASPWTCLVVVLIALPFGAASGRRNVFVGVAASIAIAFSYFVLQQLGLALGTGGYLPPWLAAWLPNLIFGLAGVWMAARVR